MPDQNPPPPPDDARDDGPDRRGREPRRAVAFSAWTKTVPATRTSISFAALKWLVLRSSRAWGSYGGIPTTLTPAFFSRIDQSEPVVVLRTHLERAPRPAPGRGPDVLAVLCSFAPAGHGTPRVSFGPNPPVWPRLVNELLCDPDDYVRVAHGTSMLAAWSPEEFQILKLYGMHATRIDDPPEALPEGTVGTVRPDGSVVLDPPTG